MVLKLKRKWVCSKCKREYPKMEGTCYRGCQNVNTISESTANSGSVPAKPVNREVKRIQRRSKTSERDIARRMLQVDGADPAYRNIASSTGRIGHITGIRVDAISRTYVTENKNRKMPSWLIQAWVLIQQRSFDFNKNALLHVDPPNMPRTFPSQGITRKSETMAIITQARHEELIKHERILEALMHRVGTDRKFEELHSLYQSLQAHNSLED